MNLSVSLGVYVKLSAVMFLEYAVWGAWAPVLAARLLGPLKMSGKQTGWVYSTLPIACIVSPLLAGQAADKWVNTEWILAACHLVGAVLLFFAGFRGHTCLFFLLATIKRLRIPQVINANIEYHPPYCDTHHPIYLCYIKPKKTSFYTLKKSFTPTLEF